MLSKAKEYLFLTTLILFILEILTLPLVMGVTYADRSDSPEHILTFSGSHLTWNPETKVDGQGTALISLFDKIYQNVEAEDNEKLIAPGTNGIDTVRVKNDSEEVLRYTAVLYFVESTDDLSVDVKLSGSDFSDTENYSLPKNISDSSVIRAVTGTIGSRKLQDFDIEWEWIFEESDIQDLTDTNLGDKAAEGSPDNITVGLYITAEGDSDETIVPSPKTGDNLFMRGYFVLLCISGVLVIVLPIMGRRGAKNNED